MPGCVLESESPTRPVARGAFSKPVGLFSLLSSPFSLLAPKFVGIILILALTHALKLELR